MRVLTFRQAVVPAAEVEMQDSWIDEAISTPVLGDELGAIDTGAVERVLRSRGYCPGGLKERKTTRQVRRYSDAECISKGVDDALRAYSRYIHGKVVERSQWRSLVNYAYRKARDYASQTRTETHTERRWECDRGWREVI